MGRSGDHPVGREPQGRGGSEPRRSAQGGGAGWTGSAGLCSAYKQAPPSSPPPRCGPALCTLSTSDTEPLLWWSPRPRSSLCVSGSVFFSLSPHFPDHPLHGGVDFRGLGSSSPTLLPVLCSGSGSCLWASGQPFSGVSPKLTFRPTPPFSPTFQLPPALGGPSRKPCSFLRLGTSPAELATFPRILPPNPQVLPCPLEFAVLVIGTRLERLSSPWHFISCCHVLITDGMEFSHKGCRTRWSVPYPHPRAFALALISTRDALPALGTTVCRAPRRRQLLREASPGSLTPVLPFLFLISGCDCVLCYFFCLVAYCLPFPLRIAPGRQGP